MEVKVVPFDSYGSGSHNCVVFILFGICLGNLEGVKHHR